MEPRCRICHCKITDENRVTYKQGDNIFTTDICNKCNDFKPRNRHEKRMLKAKEMKK